jgi:hypothetical protein
VGLTAEETAVGVRRRARISGGGAAGVDAARRGSAKVSGGGARVATAAARGKMGAKSEMSACPS